jgi:peptide/nickel transport system ATP-binding protein
MRTNVSQPSRDGHGRTLTAHVEDTARQEGARTEPPVLAIDHLSVAYATREGLVEAVRDVSLRVNAGETLGIVGESGCGKSTLAYAVMGYLAENGQITAGSIRLRGRELLGLPPGELRRLRGARMAMVYQDPATALNPSMIVGDQVAEAYQTYSGVSQHLAWRRAVEMLGRVGLPDPERMAHRYPHQLSGGQQQRVVIAMALINNPDLLIMDEPTTGLDVTTEALILDLINELKQEFGVATLYISHNLGVIAQVCDRVAVMYAGEVVEEAGVATLFSSPRHPYTVGLLGCVPRLDAAKTTRQLRPIPGHVPPPGARPDGCIFAPRCALARDYCHEAAPQLQATDQSGQRARCHFWTEVPAWTQEEARPAPEGEQRASRSTQPTSRGDGTLVRHAEPLLEVRELRRHYGGSTGIAAPLLRLLGRETPPVRAVDGVSFTIAPGETLALIGESGCGKTTLARTVAGLLSPSGGTIHFLGHDVSYTAERRPAALRRFLQMVFQNPDSSLNPRHTVGAILERPLRLFLGLRGTAARQRALELLQAVQLDPRYYHRYPGQLSGGEKQRVSIARAFAGEPRLVICDEAVSALDVSVQAAILNLLAALQAERGTSYLFISHDLGAVRYLADRIAVMYLGRIVEIGRTEDLFHPPYHPYTEALLSAIPEPDPQQKRRRIRLEGPVPSPAERPAGCPFAGRCPRYLGSLCDDVPPPVQDAGNGHHIACHIPLRELAEMQRSGKPPVRAAACDGTRAACRDE